MEDVVSCLWVAGDKNRIQTGLSKKGTFGPQTGKSKLVLLVLDRLDPGAQEVLLGFFLSHGSACLYFTSFSGAISVTVYKYKGTLLRHKKIRKPGNM